MRKISAITDTADSDSEFTDGSVASGVSPTLLPALWFNVIQRELVALVEGADLELDSTNDAQVLAAVQSLIADVAGTLTSSYFKDPVTGLIIQWGTHTFTPLAKNTITLPKAFSSKFYGCWMIDTGNSVLPMSCAVSGLTAINCWVAGAAYDYQGNRVTLDSSSVVTGMYLAIGK